MIVSCGHDENGKYRNGTAGDQTGTEYYERTYYVPSYGWDCVLRSPIANVGARIASLSLKAAQNNKIGYDQNQRLTFYNQLKSVNWDPSKITVPCEADCSSSTAAIIIATGYQLNIPSYKKLNPSLTTKNMKDALKAVGFTVFTDRTYLTSDQYLKEGDIILSEAHHVVVCVTNGTGSATTGGTKVIGTKVTQYAGLTNVQTFLNVRTGPGVEYPVVKLSNGNAFVIPNGIPVSIDREQGRWGHMTNADDKEYWVNLNYIKR